MKRLEQAAADLRQRAERLAAKRTAAQAELDRAVSARQSYAIEGDLDDGAAADRAMARLQSDVDVATSTLAGFDSAYTTITAQLAEAERVLLDEQQSVERKAAADALAQDIAAIEAQVGPWLEATRGLAADLEKLAVVRFDAGAVARFLTNAAGESEIALAVCVPDLRGAVDAIAAGRQEIPRQPAPPAPVIALPPPETMRVFILKNVRWIDASGAKQISRRFVDADLTPSAARAALSRGSACKMDDPRRLQLFGRQGTAHARMPTDAECEDLDAPARSTAEPILHSAFERVDRGSPVVGRIPREKAAS
jgi:hypothetical protein